MPEEYTVQDRADIIKQAMPPIELSDLEKRQVEEVMYTLSEAYEVPERLDPDQVVLIWRAIELVKAGKFTEEMRL